MGKRATPGAPRKKSALLGRSSFRSFSWGFFSPCVFHGSEQNHKNFRYILKCDPPGATRKRSAPRVALFPVHFGGDFVARISGRSLFRSFSWCFCDGSGFFRPRNKERPQMRATKSPRKWTEKRATLGALFFRVALFSGRSRGFAL